MNRSVVPLRHNSLPGDIRLPRRFATPNLAQTTRETDGPVDRIDDLCQAMLWVKQELILLRQHDVLLKRQFCHIHETIKTLQSNSFCPHLHTNSTSSLNSTASNDLSIDNYCVRSATSATVLQDYDDCADDSLFSSRPRTSSMKTTRDLAALARRRGSKELI